MQSQYQYQLSTLSKHELPLFLSYFLFSEINEYLLTFKTRINVIYARAFRPFNRRTALCDASYELKVRHMLIRKTSIQSPLLLSLLFGFYEIVYCFLLLLSQLIICPLNKNLFLFWLQFSTVISHHYTAITLQDYDCWWSIHENNKKTEKRP